MEKFTLDGVFDFGGVLFVPGEKPEALGCTMLEEDTSEWKTKVDQKQLGHRPGSNLPNLGRKAHVGEEAGR